MTVLISPDIKKESKQIDKDGNTVVPFTKKVIEAVEQPYVPTKEEIENMAKKGSVTQEQAKLDNPLADMIKNEVQKAILESVKSIDISAMVKEAVKDAFKQ